MENITNREFTYFVAAVHKALLRMPEFKKLSAYDIGQYCQTLINGATVFNTLACMQCSDRLDLVDSANDGSNPAIDALEEKFKAFTLKYLGLRLITSGDPRGTVFKLVVPDDLGDSFGDRTHLCVPCNDAYYCN